MQDVSKMARWGRLTMNPLEYLEREVSFEGQEGLVWGKEEFKF